MKRPLILSAAALAAGTALAIGTPLAASAHVGVSATSTSPGSGSVLTFSVGHGCDGSPTTRVAIEIPETILSVTPTVNPNWTIEKQYEPLDEPVEQEHGDALEQRVSAVVYTAVTPLAADQRDTFALSMTLVGEPGEVLEFRTTQSCVAGEQVWEGEDVPSVTLTGTDDADTAAPAPTEPAPAAETDVLARVFGIAGLALGAAGLALGLTARRRSAR